MTRRPTSSVLCAAAALLAAVPAWAVPESLLRNSPFMPSGSAAAVQPTQPGRLELRGILAMGGTPRFTIFDTSNNRAVWLAVGESDGGIRVSAYDPSVEAVTVELDGQSQRLTMKEAQIVNVAVAMPTPSANVMPSQPAAANPVPAANEQEIQERRNRIVEELRRRRALRQAPTPQPPHP